MMTHMAAQDTGRDDCLAGYGCIVAAHQRYRVPATFPVVARLPNRRGLWPSVRCTVGLPIVVKEGTILRYARNPMRGLSS